jgi:ABC-type multidrug transport system fused ATPase/permease subunit
MATNMAQVALGGTSFEIYDNTTLAYQTPIFKSHICWKHPWDVRQARFEPCFVPAVAALPAVVAAIVVLWQAIRIAIPWRPHWTLPFSTDDPDPYYDELLLAAISKTSGYLLLLWFLVGAGAIIRVAQAAIAWPTTEGIWQCAPWFLAIALLVVQKPRTTPISVLIILASSIVCQSVVMANHDQWSKTDMGLDTTALILNILAVFVILLMPLRDPSLPASSISKPFTESTASLRSPEDNLSLWQFMTVSWMTPLIQTGFKRQLDDADVWQLGYEFQHRGLHRNFRRLKGTVMQRLLTANGIDLVIITALGILETVLGFAVPVLLQKILSSMQDITAPKSAAIVYAALTMGVQLIKCQSGVFSLWFGRRCYERSRGEMITMLYEKTLMRKISFNPSKSKTEGDGAAEPDSNSNGNGHAKSTKQSAPWLSNLFAKLRRSKRTEEVKEPASMGKILNLMRNDVYEVAQRFWEFQSLITKPLSVVFSLSLVVNFLGWPAMLAVFLMIAAQITNAILVRFLVMFETQRRKATDGKLQIISQFVEAIRHLRWYGWQNAWLSQIMSARQKELNWRIVTGLWGLLISFINSLALDLSPSIGFYAYTVIGKKPLTVDVAFPALTLFNLLTNSLQDLPNLITVLLNAYVAVGRIEDFMAEPDKDEASTPAQGDSLSVNHATFAWPGTPKPVLRNISLTFSQGLSVVCGEVASGKTALLQALLGEMDMLEGRLTVPREPVGYCSQTPWLQSMSIRENILFSAEYEDERYRDVLDACALTPDLLEFKAGDLSFIGENGIGLSGGQKARVALARAAYSRSQMLFLDDPLSALDQQTAESIVQKLFAGPLMKGRTIVLVTHRVDLVLGIAEQLIKLESGVATVIDNDEPPAEFLHRTMSAVSTEEADQKDTKQNKKKAVPEKFIEDEHRALGGVKASVYWEYIKAGKLQWWFLLVVTLVLYRLLALSGAWLLKSWGEAYQTESDLSYDPSGAIHGSGIFDRLPPPSENIRPWILTFFLIGLGRTVVWSISRAIMILIIYKAGKQMFRDIMIKVGHANFRFYDVTPVGRLMNRMTSDVGVLDGNISEQFNVVTWLAISWISAVAVIATVTPIFLLFSVALTAAFILIFRRFLPTSQSLRRLESVSLSPLMANFGELLNGLVTVRAFKAQDRFQDRVIRVVDTFQKMDHFYWSLQAWLMYRYDALSAISTFLLTLLALVTGVSPGLTAFLLNSAQKFVNSTHYLCRQYGQLQMEFVSVERVVELLHIEQESEGKIHPPAWWPSFSGDIVFNNVTIKYAPHLDPALAGVSFTIKGGSKTAVIGRTGSGKSTLALTMLATILPSGGSIIVDNVDLAQVDKQILRTRITFLAQDPVLFPGTMRDNLDPLKEHSDDACTGVLQRVCDRQGWSLETPIDGGGRNLSQGQRQLVGLARAVLRRSAIIILDEATASIDMETAMQIQQVLHEEMKESTVITIAHRLEAVKGADYCLVLGKGKVLEQGPAEEMLRTKRERLEREADE